MKPERRSCGLCTACCEGWLVIKTNTIETYPGVPCKHVISDQGCGIYNDRTEQICSAFICSWIKDDEAFPKWMQPNLSNAIVMHRRVDWKGEKLDLVVPVGPRIPKKTLLWLNNFSRTNKRPYIYAELMVSNGKLTGNRQIKIFAPQPMRGEILAWLETGNKFW